MKNSLMRPKPWHKRNICIAGDDVVFMLVACFLSGMAATCILIQVLAMLGFE